MVESPIMPKGETPQGLPLEELVEILRSKVRDPENVALSTHISKETNRILDRAAKRYGVDKRKALEIIVRQWRGRR